MPELIDRHALLKKVYEHPQERERMTDGEWCRKCIYEAPKVEAVRHGRWIRRETVLGTECKCSVCGYKDFVPKHDNYWFRRKFCPNCGARMDATDTNVGGKGGADNG